MQFIASFTIGAEFVINPSAQNLLQVFMNYQQRLQTPFVKSYVPLLPYNNLSLGGSMH